MGLDNLIYEKQEPIKDKKLAEIERIMILADKIYTDKIRIC